MKSVLHLVLVVFALGCGAQKESSGLTKLQDPVELKMRNCLADGNCSINIIPNSSMKLKKDTFGQLYGEPVKSELLLFKLSYDRKAPKGVADANYSETYYFSIPKNTSTLDLKNEQLSQINLVVERRCFCKGTAGFFKILSGNLKLSIKKNDLTLSGNFSHENLPLLMTKIDEKVSLEP